MKSLTDNNVSLHEEENVSSSPTLLRIQNNPESGEKIGDLDETSSENNIATPFRTQTGEAINGLEMKEWTHMSNEHTLGEICSEEEEEEGKSMEIMRCGVGNCTPDWLQRLASKKAYIIVIGIFGLLDSATNSYFIATLSTIEKRFKINSQMSGILSGSFDIGVLVSSLLFSYLGARGRKIRWMAFGTILLAIGCFMKVAPHVIYGPGQDAIEFTVEAGEKNRRNASTYGMESYGMCMADNKYTDDCYEDTGFSVPVIILLASHILSGVGCAVYFTIGMAYMDDNMQKNKAPFGLALLNCIRLLGPSVGYFIASYSLKIFIDPSLHPTITNDDPKYIGAWWYGWIPFGLTSIVISFLISLFPKALPRTEMRRQKNITHTPNQRASFKDFSQTVKRIMKNKVFFFNTTSAIAYMFGLIGQWNFLPKYIETQFRQSASTASFVTGSFGLGCSALGFFFGGLFISKLRPHARTLALMSVVFEFAEAFSFIIYAFLRCEDMNLHGRFSDDNSWDLKMQCNSHCDCDENLKFTPVCSSDSVTTFYSVCHAGCTTNYEINGTEYFGNCSCIESGWSTAGICPADCLSNFTIYLVLQCIMKFVIALGKTGNTIIHLRCVSPEDKAVAIGLTETLLCATCFVPGPILVGSLLDYTCIIWGMTCGKQGHCWLYDGKALGYSMNFFTAGFVFLAAVLDIGVWVNVKNFEIYDENEEHEKISPSKDIHSGDESEAEKNEKKIYE